MKYWVYGNNRKKKYQNFLYTKILIFFLKNCRNNTYILNIFILLLNLYNISVIFIYFLLGNNVLENPQAAVCIHGKSIGSIENFNEQVLIAFTCYYVFNYKYPQGIEATLEFIQRYGIIKGKILQVKKIKFIQIKLSISSYLY